MKGKKCACGVSSKAHAGKSRRKQLPHRGVQTDRWGNVVRRPNRKKA